MTVYDSEYEHGYRDGFCAACGHYPGCPNINAHMMGATHCSGCGAEQGPLNSPHHSHAITPLAHISEEGGHASVCYCPIGYNH